MVKTVLLTGATGFIGSHLLERLIKNGYEVVILKRSFSDTWRVNHILGEAKTYDIDKCDLEKPFKENSIDCVVHLASSYVKRHSGQSDIETLIESNVKFPANLCEYCKSYSVPNFINAGTFFEYRVSNRTFSENSDIFPYNLYAATKVAFNSVLRHFSEDQGLNVIDLKLFAPYGEKDNEKLFVFLIKALLNDDEIDFSGGEQRRNFIYVVDVVDAYIKALKKIEKIRGFESINIGGDRVYSIKDVVGMLEKISGRKLKINWGSKPYVDNEIFYSNCKITKAEKMLGWRPRYDLSGGLKKTYNYHVKTLEKEGL